MFQPPAARARVSAVVRGDGGSARAARGGWRWRSVTRAGVLLAAAGLGGAAGAGLTGCASPLDHEPEQALRRSIVDSVRREVRESQGVPASMTLQRQERVAALELSPGVLEELERMSGTGSYAGPEAAVTSFGPTLLGTAQDVVRVNLERAIATTVNHNLNVQFARLTPAINESRLAQAQAAFDWVFFTDFQWSRVDQENVNSQAGFPPAGRLLDERQVLETTAGLRKRNTSGGLFTVQQGLTYTDNEVEGTFATPDPANEANLTVQYDQPLLRNFGGDAALAEVRLAGNAERDSVQSLRSELIRQVTEAETAYWTLSRAYGELQIARRLLERGVQVQEVLKVRKEQFDANPSQYANAVSTVETRRTDVITAENNVRTASDRLKATMNDPAVTVGSELLVLPVDRAVDAPVQFSLLDALTTALGNRPELQRALLAIDDTAIRERLARNQRLPQLDLRAQARFNALENGADTALSRQAEADLVDMLVGVSFEQPVGNRAAEAEYRRRRLEQVQAVTTYRDVVQRIVLEVKDALRDVTTNYLLIEQTRSARVAAAENLRTLEVREETLQSLTPEFLDLKLRFQQSLASAEQRELAALTEYNVALARLYAAMGTALERNRIQFVVPDAPGAGALSPAARPDRP